MQLVLRGPGRRQFTTLSFYRAYHTQNEEGGLKVISDVVSINWAIPEAGMPTSASYQVAIIGLARAHAYETFGFVGSAPSCPYPSQFSGK